MALPHKSFGFERLILREMWYSRWNTIACMLVVTAAVGLYVAMQDMGAASVDATRRLMRDMGFNLQIIPASADPARYQALDFAGPDMPETYVEQLVAGRLILAQHFVGKLQHTVRVNDYTVVLTGVLGQSVRTGTARTPMPTSYMVPPGEVFVGAAAARGLGLQAGDHLDILSRVFEVTRILPEYGAVPEDIRVFAHLRDVQELLDRPGRINSIDALACQCPADAKDIVSLVRESIEAALPGVRVQPYYSILLARHEQRVLMRRIQLAVLAGALTAAAAALWGLTYQNASARHHEIGVLRALGFSDVRILFMFLSKTAAYALAGAVAGCVLGRSFSYAAQLVEDPSVLPARGALLLLLPVTVLAALLFCLPPVLGKLLQDPADILAESVR